MKRKELKKEPCVHKTMKLEMICKKIPRKYFVARKIGEPKTEKRRKCAKDEFVHRKIEMPETKKV